MKKNLQTAFQTRQYMLSKDYEIYYYCDRTLPQVEIGRASCRERVSASV